MKDIENKFLPLFLKIAIGFLILASIFPFVVNHFFSDWTKSGSYGDTFGALNALFSGLALAGVIVTIFVQRTEMKNQRLELNLQRNEMKESRQEYLLSRTTTIVYNQLDKFENALSHLAIKNPDGAILQGNDAIFFLRDLQDKVYQSLHPIQQAPGADTKTAIIKLLKVHHLNHSEFEKFAHSAYTSVEVLKRIIFETNLDVNQLSDLKSLFFVNIGHVNMGVIERLYEVPAFQLKYLNEKDLAENDLSADAIISPNIFLESIVEFYHLHLTQENFAEQKSKWLESIEPRP